MSTTWNLKKSQIAIITAICDLADLITPSFAILVVPFNDNRKCFQLFAFLVLAI